MRDIWLLPDRNQTGCIQAVEKETTYYLHELINLKELPPSFVLGIPEEIYRSTLENMFFFAQFVYLDTGSRVFCLSAPAGKDISGRIVSISNLQFLEKDEEPNLQFRSPQIITGEDKEIIDTVFSNQNKKYINLFDTVIEMLNAVKTVKNARSFSSYRLVCARNKPDWMPQKKIYYLM